MAVGAGKRFWALLLAAEDTVESRQQKEFLIALPGSNYPTHTGASENTCATVSDDFKVVLDNDAYELFVRIRLSGYTQRDALAETLKQMIPANLVLLLQTAIPQTVLRPASVVGAAMVNMVRHEHHPEGGNTNGTI